jgi:dTDP-glucose pyrophosphorylase
MPVEPSEILGVILAAGKGSRMLQLPTSLPKCVLPVLGKPILYHQLQLMAKLGIRTVYIVVGHRGFEVVREIERLPSPGIAIRYVEQQETLGIAHCVGCLEPLLDRPFFLFLGDIYLRAPRIGEMLATMAEHSADAVLGAIREDDSEAIRRNFCIVEDEAGLVKRVVEKPRYPQSNLKGVGVYLFTPMVFDAVRRTPRTAMRDEYEITDSIQIMIDDGHQVRATTCIDADINVTFPKDLLAVNLEALKEHGLGQHVEPGATLGPDVTIRESVIGHRATIGPKARLIESLVFGDAVVRPGAEFCRTIVTPEGVCSV